MSLASTPLKAQSAVRQPGTNSANLQGTRERAAGTIQRTYRGHRTRRELDGLGLDASTRWTEVLRDAQYHKLTTPVAPSDAATNDGPEPSSGVEGRKLSPAARKNWQRIGIIARRAGRDDLSTFRSSTSLDNDTNSSEHDENHASVEEKHEKRRKRVGSHDARQESAKMMDLQYFLEMVDQKHRYGSSLRKYHNYWKSQSTSQSFFYWLDYGEGKDVELAECDRARLDKEQVRYLSREERLNYLVTVDPQGSLRWAKNGEKVWTNDTLYKDSMQGIVPVNSQVPEFHYNVRPEGVEPEETSSSSEENLSEENDPDNRYMNDKSHDAKGGAGLKEVSPSVIFNNLFREHMKKGHKWIFVADTSFRLYVGIKQSGAFQHSSFLHGARISAAGLIKVKDGQLRSLALLSGHYRPPAANFQNFIHSLQDKGVDMSRLSIPKSYAVLVGMETYTGTKRKARQIESSLKHEKDKILHPEKVKQQDEQQKDKSQSAEKERQHLDKLRLEDDKMRQSRKEDESSRSRIVRRLGLGVKDDDEERKYGE